MLNYSLTKNWWMSTGKKTVSPEALRAEWLEIEAAQRDPAMFRPLYNRYYEPVFLLIFRRTADEALTADLCSQAFLKAMQKLPDYEYKGVPFSSWLYRIAINETTQHFRQAQRNRMVSIEDAGLQDLMTEMDEPHHDDRSLADKPKSYVHAPLPIYLSRAQVLCPAARISLGSAWSASLLSTHASP